MEGIETSEGGNPMTLPVLQGLTYLGSVLDVTGSGVHLSSKTIG